MLDLLFGPATDSSAPDTSSRLWTDPVVRQAAALLLELGLGQLFSGYESMTSSGQPPGTEELLMSRAMPSLRWVVQEICARTQTLAFHLLVMISFTKI